MVKLSVVLARVPTVLLMDMLLLQVHPPTAASLEAARRKGEKCVQKLMGLRAGMDGENEISGFTLVGPPTVDFLRGGETLERETIR